MSSRIINITALFVSIVLTVYILAIARNLLLPFVTAVVIWYLIMSLADTLQAQTVLGRRLPSSLSVFFAVVMTYFILHSLFVMIAQSIYSIASDASLYQAKLSWLISLVNKKTHLDLKAETLFSHIDLANVFTNMAIALTSLLQNLLVIIVYVIFLLLEAKSFQPKLAAMSRSKTQYRNIVKLINNIKNDINSYVRIKTFVSVLTGLLSYFILLAFGMRHAEFWGILIFLLNYIPTIGSIVALTLTLLVLSVQFTHVMVFVSMAGALVAIQFLIGNILEPKLTGATLNLSPIVILLSLSLWGSVWGIIGMLLCVPLMTILNIILSQFDSMRPIAILLTADGRLPAHARDTA